MWNKAEVVKPEDMQQVWVTFHWEVPVNEGGYENHQGYAIWSDEDGWFFDVCTDSTLMCRKICEEKGLLPCTITHWMPLPNEPEGLK